MMGTMTEHMSGRWAALAFLSALIGCGKVSDSTGEGPDAGASTSIEGPSDSEGPTDPDAAASPDARAPSKPNPKAHPHLVGLPDNTALDLGRYACEERAPGTRCQSVFDYSRFNYDPFNHRLVLFGGGHAATGRTDVDSFNLDTLTWESLYPSMTCDEIAKGDIDPRGFHRSSGRPVARHTYDMNVIAQVNGAGRWLMFSNEGFSGNCHQYNAPINAISSFALTPGNTSWEYSDAFEPRLPWHYAAAAEFDPVSGNVVILGSGAGASPGGLYIVDPATLRVVAKATVHDNLKHEGLSSNLVNYPPTGNMYLFSRPGDDSVRNGVFEVVLNRQDWPKTTSIKVDVKGVSPRFQGGFAYDSHTQRIGGAARDPGVFYTFDPATKTWESETMNVVSDEGVSPGSIMAHNVDYDPVNNVFFFVTAQGPLNYRLWAYRYRN